MNGNGNFGGSKIGGVVFLLNNLPIELDYVESMSTIHRPLPDVAATYMLPLQQILLSKLNAAGLIRHIFVNFGPLGCYEVISTAKPITEIKTFVELLRNLCLAGKIHNPKNGEVVWRAITNLPGLLSVTHENWTKIGCLHGVGFPSRGSVIMSIDEYIRAASNEQIFVFVIGRIDIQIQSCIHDYVNVFDNITPTEELSCVISWMEFKFGIA